jgi:hypothetical protein
MLAALRRWAEAEEYFEICVTNSGSCFADGGSEKVEVGSIDIDGKGIMIFLTEFLTMRIS